MTIIVALRDRLWVVCVAAVEHSEWYRSTRVGSRFMHWVYRRMDMPDACQLTGCWVSGDVHVGIEVR